MGDSIDTFFLSESYSGLLNGCAGKTHQAVEDVAIMRSILHMTVLAPGDANELRRPSVRDRRNDR